MNSIYTVDWYYLNSVCSVCIQQKKFTRNNSLTCVHSLIMQLWDNLQIPYYCFLSVHVGSVRQTATIIAMNHEHLRTGDKSTVRFRFIKNPEYLRKDLRMVFREGRTKAIGTVTKLYPHVRAVAQNTRQQRSAKKAQESNHQGPRLPQNEPQKASKKRRGVKHKTTDYSDMKENSEMSIPTT